jgi:hypothetical protein
MLVFQDPTQTGTPTVPLCLSEWEPRPGYALCHREGDGGHIVGIGSSVAFPSPRRWHALDDGWRVGLNAREFVPAAIERAQGWFDTESVDDLRGRRWSAPVILTREGSRAFRVTYGATWLPDLTPEQERAEKIAQAARVEILKAYAGHDADLEMATACQWAAELLALTHHLTPGVLGALGLMDDGLAMGVLRVATSLPFRLEQQA